MDSLPAFLLLLVVVPLATLYAGFIAGAAWAREGAADRADEWLEGKRAYVAALRGTTVHPRNRSHHERQLAQAEESLSRAVGASEAAHYEASEWSFLTPWRERLLLSQHMWALRQWLRRVVRRG